MSSAEEQLRKKTVIAVNNNDAGLAGEVVDARFRYGMNYRENQQWFAQVAGCDADRFEGLMYEADSLAGRPAARVMPEGTPEPRGKTPLNDRGLGKDATGDSQIQRPSDGTEAKKYADQAIDKLADALKAGKSEQLTEYLRAMGRFHRYSLRNVMLISRQRPDATQVAGFTTWKTLGRWVRKGERGIMVIAPMRVKVQAAEAAGDQTRLVGFRAARVFDISQTDGKLLPEHSEVRGNPTHYLAQLRDWVQARGIELDYREDLGGADGFSAGGLIAIRQGLSPAEEFATLAHEMAHELLHKGPVRDSKVVREAEAEAVSFVICDAVGLETNTASSDYIQLHGGSTETLVASLGRIRDAATEVLSGIMPNQVLAAAKAGPDQASKPKGLKKSLGGLSL